MAIKFDEVNDYYLIADDASMTLPDSDWCIGFWERLDDSTGNGFQYVISNQNFGLASGFNIHVGEVDAGGDVAGRWNCLLRNTSNTNILSDVAGEGKSTSTTAGDDIPRLWIFQRISDVFEMWDCKIGATPTLQATDTTPLNWTAIDGIGFVLGGRQGFSSTRFYGGVLGSFFKGSFSLVSSEVEALGAGVSILDLGYTPDCYLEMKTAVATIRDLVGSNDATRNSVPTTVEDFPRVENNVIDIFSAVTVPGVGGFPKNLLHSMKMRHLLTR